MLHKRLILALLYIIAVLPVVVIPYPTYATTMANNTATSNFSIRQNPTTAVWSQGTFNYVGCVRGDNDTKYGIGIRFSAVPIPQGSTISSAYLVVTSAASYDQDAVNSTVQGEDDDSAAAFSTVANYQARTRTTAYEAWTGIEHWTAGTQYPSPDISDVIEEIVGRAGWVSGNNMVLFWDDHSAMSSQGSYVPPIVRGGSSYLLMVEYTDPTAATVPVITTKDASDVGSTTGVLNVYINDDGDDENGVSVRFGYDTVSHAADFSLYSTIGSWSTSNYSSNDLATQALTGLTAGTHYYFNAQGQNSAGTVNGTEVEFVTPAAVATLSPSSFIILPQTTSVELQWTKPSGFSQSRLYYTVGMIPTSNTTGTLLYSGTDSTYTHSSLTSGTTYGYRLYGFEGAAGTGTWSASTTGIITTKGTSTGTGLVNPTEILDWFQKTDYTTQNATFWFPIVNNLADSFSMPRNTAWLTWALAVSMFFGFLVWSASRSMMATAAAVCAGIILGVAQTLLPKYMVMMVIVFAVSIIAVRERI